MTANVSNKRIRAVSAADFQPSGSSLSQTNTAATDYYHPAKPDRLLQTV